MSSLPDTIPYYNPWEIDTVIDLATTSVDKTFQFDWDTDVIAESKVAVTLNERTVATYTVDSGLTITNANRTITLTLSGADFADLEGETLTVQCNFFDAGDIEVVFKLRIVKSNL